MEQSCSRVATREGGVYDLVHRQNQRQLASLGVLVTVFCPHQLATLTPFIHLNLLLNTASVYSPLWPCSAAHIQTCLRRSRRPFIIPYLNTSRLYLISVHHRLLPSHSLSMEDMATSHSNNRVRWAAVPGHMACIHRLAVS